MGAEVSRQGDPSLAGRVGPSQKVLKISRVRLGPVVRFPSLAGRVGSGRVGSGRIGSGTQVFKYHGSGRVGSVQEFFSISRVGLGHLIRPDSTRDI